MLGQQQIYAQPPLSCCPFEANAYVSKCPRTCAFFITHPASVILMRAKKQFKQFTLLMARYCLVPPTHTITHSNHSRNNSSFLCSALAHTVTQSCYSHNTTIPHYCATHSHSHSILLLAHQLCSCATHPHNQSILAGMLPLINTVSKLSLKRNFKLEPFACMFDAEHTLFRPPRPSPSLHKTALF